MDIANLIGDRYKSKPTTYHRRLNNDPINGTLASGYIPKDRSHGSHYDYLTDSYHGLLIVSGTGTYSDSTTSLSVQPGDFIQRLPGRTHTTLITSDDYAEIYIILGKNLFHDLCELNVCQKHSPVLHPGIDFETIQSILHIQDQLSFLDNPELSLLVPQFISYLTRITYLSKTNNQSSSEKDILDLATKYIQQNIHTRLTVEEVANHVNLGYEKFRKLFASHYNMSPGNYIIHQRINKSQGMLSQRDYSIKEIAYQLGYVDTYTFSKQFKKITGRTPSDFQNIFV